MLDCQQKMANSVVEMVPNCIDPLARHRSALWCYYCKEHQLRFRLNAQDRFGPSDIAEEYARQICEYVGCPKVSIPMKHEVTL